MSETTYTCKIGFMEIYFSKIALSITITWYFETTSRVMVHHTKFSNSNRTKTNHNWLNHLHKLNYTSPLAESLRRSFLPPGLPKKILDSRKEAFFKINTLKDFTIFPRKPLCWSIILIKPATLLKRNFNTGVFL